MFHKKVWLKYSIDCFICLLSKKLNNVNDTGLLGYSWRNPIIISQWNEWQHLCKIYKTLTPKNRFLSFTVYSGDMNLNDLSLTVEETVLGVLTYQTCILTLNTAVQCIVGSICFYLDMQFTHVLFCCVFSRWW